MKANPESKKKTTFTKIVVMDTHFLYLPLFYAKHKNFFGFLPPNYSVDIVRSSDRTDLSAFSMLMDTTSTKNMGIDFAVCDPACVLDTGYDSGPSPVVLAELISNTAFWAIDRKSPPTAFLKDLGQFTKIIAFHPGTTSYGIASRISRDGGKDLHTIKSVYPNEELSALRGSASGTVALSPDILGIDHLLSNFDEFKIYLALGTTREYSSVLLTGLMTRDDVVRDHRDLVAGLLKALQQSMILIRHVTPDSITYANERFSGYGEDVVVRAFKRAEEGHVFPATIEVREAHWLNAAQVAADAKGDLYDPTEALRIYQQHIAPFAPLAQQAAREVYMQITSALEAAPSKTSFWRLYGLPTIWIGLGAASTLWFHWSSPIVIALMLITGTYIAGLVRFAPSSTGFYLHWTFLIMIVLLVIFGITYHRNGQMILGMIVAVSLSEAAIIHAESKKR
jgi:hypothetical protein